MFFHEAAGTKAAHLLQCLRLTLAQRLVFFHEAPKGGSGLGVDLCFCMRLTLAKI